MFVSQEFVNILDFAQKPLISVKIMFLPTFVIKTKNSRALLDFLY